MAITLPTPGQHDDYRFEELEVGFECGVIAPECSVTDRRHRIGSVHSLHDHMAQEITAGPWGNEEAFLKSFHSIHSKNPGCCGKVFLTSSTNVAFPMTFYSKLTQL